jgi:hypothetical protein
MLRRFILFVFAFCLAYPAWGAEPAKRPKIEPGTAVEMPFLMVPMSKDGDLLGYSYVASKLICTTSGGTIRVREKLAFIQDAFVREANGKPVSLATDPKMVDKDLLIARLTAAAQRIVGVQTVRTMVLVEIKFAPLHPSDSTPAVAPPAQPPAEATPNGGTAPGGAAKSASSEGATSKPASGP